MIYLQTTWEDLWKMVNVYYFIILQYTSLCQKLKIYKTSLTALIRKTIHENNVYSSIVKMQYNCKMLTPFIIYFLFLTISHLCYQNNFYFHYPQRIYLQNNCRMLFLNRYSQYFLTKLCSNIYIWIVHLISAREWHKFLKMLFIIR